MKVMLVVFFDWQGVLHYEFIPRGQTVNMEFYVAVLKLWGKVYVGRGLSCGWTKVGCCTVTVHQPTHHSLCSIFWRKTKRLLYHSHPTLQIWLQHTFFSFLSWSLPWKDTVSTHLTRSRKIWWRSCLPFRKKHSRKCSKAGRNIGSGVLLAKETTWRQQTWISCIYQHTAFITTVRVFIDHTSYLGVIRSRPTA